MGYYTAPENKSYYNGGDGFGSDRVQLMIKEALEWAEAEGDRQTIGL